MLLGVSLTILGLLSLFLGVLMQLLFDYSGEPTRRWLRVFAYNRSVPLSLLGFFAGMLLGVPLARRYIEAGYSLPELGPDSHLAVLGLTLMIASFMSFTFTLVLHATQVAVAPQGLLDAHRGLRAVAHAHRRRPLRRVALGPADSPLGEDLSRQAGGRLRLRVPGQLQPHGARRGGLAGAGGRGGRRGPQVGGQGSGAGGPAARDARAAPRRIARRGPLRVGARAPVGRGRHAAADSPPAGARRGGV